MRFPPGRHWNINAPAWVKFQVSPWGKARVSGRVVSETRHLNRRIAGPLIILILVLLVSCDSRCHAITASRKAEHRSCSCVIVRHETKFQGACRWPTIRTQTKSNRAKRSLGSIITPPATCPRKPSTLANRNLSSEQILTG
jgi:hypothetical protein